MSMNFNQSQSMKLGQSMKLAPRVIQSMEILQLPQAELEERIEQELEGNITLELAEPERDELDAPERLDDRGSDDGDGDSFDRLDEFTRDVPDVTENEFDSSARADSYRETDTGRVNSRLAGEPDARADAMAQAPARQGTVQDQLLDQWRLADVDESLVVAGELVIGSLDEDGYLRISLKEIADKAPANLGVDEAVLERALGAVQLLVDPPGTAARDVRECLLLQLDATEDDPSADHDPALIAHVRLLIESHIDDLSQNRLPKIAEATGLTMHEIKHAMEYMRRLSLAPARALAPVRSEFVIPDAIVEYDEDDDRYIAYLADRRHANLRLNQEYAKLAKDKTLEKKDRDFVRTNVTNAQWLIDAVNQRANTLLRVLRVVVDAQRDYFDYGPEQLRPLPMTQVAEQLGVHVATVSRAVADKAIQTPRGIVPLRGFFMGGLSSDTGEDVSYDAVKAALREIVDAEDKSKPLSDDALAKAIKERGIDIARRTVAKYRGQLDIPSARLRKTF